VFKRKFFVTSNRPKFDYHCWHIIIKKMMDASMMTGVINSIIMSSLSTEKVAAEAEVETEEMDIMVDGMNKDRMKIIIKMRPILYVH
jgi:hypothetical protein